MSVFRLHREQFLPIDIKAAWDFFSSPDNLKVITPDYMGFDIKTKTAGKMHEGMIIIYEVTPVLNIPMTWVSEITQINEPYFFVDRQIIGPYKLWHHQHKFKELDDGILVEDEITYSVPFGVLGSMMNSLMIKNRLKNIFDYRNHILSKTFNHSN